MKFIHKLLWAALILLCLSILIENTNAKGGRSSSRSSSRSSYSGSSYSSRSYSSFSYVNYRSYYYGANRFFNHRGTGNETGPMTTGGAIVTTLLVLCGVCCCCCFLCPRNQKQQLQRGFSERVIGFGNNNASEAEYHEAVAFQNKNVPTASPPDYYTGDPIMAIDSTAKKSLQESISINDEGNQVRFLDSVYVEDRCVLSNIRVKYFEVTITAKPDNETCIGMGLCSKPYPPMRFPGWHEHSVAYHSDNGYKFFNDSGDGSSYGPSYSTGDTVGCGFVENSDGSQAFFFTKNGRHLGTAFSTHKLRGETFACVGGDGNCEMTINFGKDASSPLQWSDPQAEGNAPLTTSTDVNKGLPMTSSTYEEVPPPNSQATAPPVQNQGAIPYQAPVQNQGFGAPKDQITGTPVPYAAPTQNQYTAPVQNQGPIPFQASNQQSSSGAPMQYQAPNQQSGFGAPAQNQGPVPYQAPPSES